MKLVRPYDYQKLNRVTHSNGSRYYESPTNVHLDSVTTILSLTADTSGLDIWRERVGIVEANRIRNEATGLGSLMHTHLENYVEGIERPQGSNHVRQLARNMADQIINRGLVNVDEVWGMEESLYYPDLWAGTADLTGLHKGVPSIMDYKTTNKPKKAEFVYDYSLQLAAYALAHNEVYGTNINKGVIFMVSRDLQYQEFVFEGIQFEACKKAWIERVELFMIAKATLL